VEEKPEIPLFNLRHCAARLVAAAVQRLFPHARLIRGEVTDTGFFYDFDLKPPFGKDAFPMIEEQLRILITEEALIRSHTMMAKNAKELFKHQKQPLKADEMESLGGLVDLIQIGDFYDECPGPYPSSLHSLKNLQLLDVQIIEGLIRVFGTVFHRANDLKKFLKQIQKLQKRKTPSHWLKIENISDGEGFLEFPCLDQFDFLKKFWLEHCQTDGISPVQSPTLQRRSFLEQYGFSGFGEGQWLLPTTLAPAHFEYMKAKKLLRVGEFCRLAQPINEAHFAGLLRSRCYTSDQVHLLCRPEEVVGELISSLHLLQKSLKMLSIEGKWFLTSYGKRTKRTSERWDFSLKCLKQAWEQSDLASFPLNEGEGNGFDPVAFVGPRIEYHYTDDLGRQWCGPYVGIWTQAPTGNEPMIERSLFGSVERLIGYTLERVEFEN